MKRILITIMLSVSVVSAPIFSIFADEKVEVSLSDCITQGLLNNLNIKIAKIESKLKGEDVLISEAIYDTALDGKATYTDDQRAQSSTLTGLRSIDTNYQFGATKTLPTGTELDFEYSDKRAWTDSTFVSNNPLHTAQIQFGFTQPVLKNFFGYVDRATIKISKIERDIAGVDAMEAIEDSVADIENAYWQLVFAYENLLLREELLKQAEKLYEIFEEHLKTGVAETTEFYGAEANMRIRKTELAIAKDDVLNASNNLRVLLNEDDDFLILPTNRLKILDKKADMTTSLNEAFMASRKYYSKKKELESKKIKVKMKANSLWPEVDIVGTYALNAVDRKFEKANRRLTTDKYPYYYGGIEVSYPLENRKARGEYRKSKLEKEKIILELIQVEKDLINEIDQKVRKVNLNRENVERWAKIRKIQELKFKEEQKKLKYGRSSSKVVIDSQNDLTTSSINENKALLDYYQSLVNLENAKDTLLAKIGVIEE